MYIYTLLIRETSGEIPDTTKKNSKQTHDKNRQMAPERKSKGFFLLDHQQKI